MLFKHKFIRMTVIFETSGSPEFQPTACRTDFGAIGFFWRKKPPTWFWNTQARGM